MSWSNSDKIDESQGTERHCAYIVIYSMSAMKARSRLVVNREYLQTNAHQTLEL